MFFGSYFHRFRSAVVSRRKYVANHHRKLCACVQPLQIPGRRTPRSDFLVHRRRRMTRWFTEGFYVTSRAPPHNTFYPPPPYLTWVEPRFRLFLPIPFFGLNTYETQPCWEGQNADWRLYQTPIFEKNVCSSTETRKNYMFVLDSNVIRIAQNIR